MPTQEQGTVNPSPEECCRAEVFLNLPSLYKHLCQQHDESHSCGSKSQNAHEKELVGPVCACSRGALQELHGVQRTNRMAEAPRSELGEASVLQRVVPESRPRHRRRRVRYNWARRSRPCLRSLGCLAGSRSPLRGKAWRGRTGIAGRKRTEAFCGGTYTRTMGGPAPWPDWALAPNVRGRLFRQRITSVPKRRLAVAAYRSSRHSGGIRPCWSFG